MPLPRSVADAFGVVTIALVAIFVVLGLVCICYSIYFRSRVLCQGFRQFGYFSGPWITRIAFVFVAIWCACGEIARLTLLKGKGRLFVGEKWQEAVCKLYIISNVGFAEPCFFLILVFLMHASLKRDHGGALSRYWNARMLGIILLLCVPMFVIQLMVVLVGPKLSVDVPNRDIKMRKYFTSTSSIDGENGERQMVCTYPLLSTIFLGLFDCLLIAYVTYLGYRMVSLVINRGLQRRIYTLSSSIIAFVSLRVSILGFSILPSQGGLAFEVIVFMAFLTLLLSATVGICILVYCPVADALALGGLRHMDLEEMVPFDDYYGGATSMTNQGRLELGRSSDASTKRGSISFRTMIRDDALPLTDGLEESGSFSPPTNNPRTQPSAASPPFPGRPVHQLRGVPEF